jgi:hypothetical protein
LPRASDIQRARAFGLMLTVRRLRAGRVQWLRLGYRKFAWLLKPNASWSLAEGCSYNDYQKREEVARKL